MPTTTIDIQSLESFRWNNKAYLGGILSPFLALYLASRDIFSLAEFTVNPVVDLTYYLSSITATSLSGIEVLAPSLEKIILPATADAIIATKVNVTNFTKLKVLNTQANRLSATQGLNVPIFIGSLVGLTTLEHLAVATLVNATLLLPKFSDNLNLKVVNLVGGYFTNLNATQVGNLSNNLLLSEFRITYKNGADATWKAAIDNILTTLRAQKVAGGAISVIDFTACPAPTGGAANADAVWLAANGVTVTLGTL